MKKALEKKLGIVEDDEEGISGYVEPDRLSPKEHQYYRRHRIDLLEQLLCWPRI